MYELMLAEMRKCRKHMGTWLSIGSPVIAELAAEYPFHWLLFDLEHGCSTEASLLSNLQAAKRDDLALIVRVGKLDSALISRVLDWGASGIMLPHTTTAEQAEECVAAMQYPPAGKRGYSGSARAFNYGLHKPSDDGIIAPLFFAQIETCEAVINVDKIAAVKGVDVLFVGPADLRLDISTNTNKLIPDFETALKKVIHAANKYGKQTGVLARSPEDLKRYFELEFNCVAYGSDLAFLKDGFENTQRLFDKPAYLCSDK